MQQPCPMLHHSTCQPPCFMGSSFGQEQCGLMASQQTVGWASTAA